MPTASTADLPPPKSWDEFEDLCADLFQKEWDDNGVARYGRQGQRQDGIDVYGSPAKGGNEGVQCKRKRIWPPTELTADDVDEAVAEALKFTHPLTKFIIATTARNDARLTDHALELTKRHRAAGLFDVQVVGWDELTRRLTQHDKLVEKHYPFVALSSLREQVPRDTAELVIDRLREVGIAGIRPPPVATGEVQPSALPLSDALERDLSLRYETVVHRSLFPEASETEGFAALAAEVLQDGFASVKQPLRYRILLRGARSTALRGQMAEAERFLSAAQQLEGPDSDLPAKARVAVAHGNVDEAIQLLRDSSDADCRSTLLNILAQNRGDATALSWYRESKLSVPDLTANGVHTLAHTFLQQENVQEAKRVVDAASDRQLADGPYLFFLRAALRMAVLFPKPDQWVPLQGPPLDLRSAHTIPSEEVVVAELDGAIADLNRFLPIASRLELPHARRIADAYLTWCDLLHPHRRARALARLRTQMARPETALQKLQFAFAYDPEFDPAGIERYLIGRQELGGLNQDELTAALTLRLNSNDPRKAADFIARHRADLEPLFGKAGITSLEIQALALAGDATSAQLAVDQNRGQLDPSLVRIIEARIATAAGADPVAAHKAAYEETKSPEALRALVSELSKLNDQRALAHYAEELYHVTQDPTDAVNLAGAVANAGEDAEFLRIASAYPFVKQHNPQLARHEAWALFRVGLLDESKRIADELRTTNAAYRDPDLEIAIAIERGAWESLAVPLSDYLDNAASHSGLSLLRVARIAQASGQGPLMGLVHAAVERSPDDPSVLIGAYTIALEEGLEDDKPAANDWFRRALDLSGQDGPIKRFELRELLSQGADWRDRVQTITDAVNRGELPLVFAASGLRATHVDVVLRNLIVNLTQNDPRKRTAVPLFSGRRIPAKLDGVDSTAIDPSALMVLAWLGLLQKVTETYSKVVLPAGALGELFQGRSRIQEFQKSRITRARTLQQGVARNRLKIVRFALSRHDPLVRQVGVELAALLRAAEENDGLVLCPAPVMRIGSEMAEEADLSAFSSRLVDTHSVLTALNDAGALDEPSEETARRYFSVQDRGWNTSPALAKGRPVYISELAAIYLISVGLLDAFLQHFDAVSFTQAPPTTQTH